MMKVLFLQNGFDLALLSHVTPMTSAAKKQNHDSSFPFSACLIVKDDNRILPEWLAYHYTILPLRHLIVAIDPLSATSPLPILNKFRELGMNIIVWEDKDYINGSTATDFKPANPATDKQTINRVFVHRQLIFYQQCLMEFKNRKKHRWTILIDTDEFLTFNYYIDSEGNYTYDWLDEIAHSLDEWSADGGHIDYYNESVKALDGIHNNFRERMDSGEHPRAKLPKVGTSTISQFISAQERTNMSAWKKYPCVNQPRLTFGSLEDSNTSLPTIPASFDPLAFQTIRHPFHENPSNWNTGKSIVDASRYDGRLPKSCHHVMNEACYPALWPQLRESTLRIHHYTGSSEDFLRIGDNFRGEKMFQDRNKLVDGTYYDNSVQSWLQAFLDLVGEKKALEVTEELRAWAIKNNEEVSAAVELGNFTYPFYVQIQ